MGELYLNKYSIKQIYKNNTNSELSGKRKILTYDTNIKGQYFKISISDSAGKIIVFEVNDGTINLIRVNGIAVSNGNPIIYIVNGEVGIDLGSIVINNVKIYIQASNSINNTYHNFESSSTNIANATKLVFKYEGSSFESTYRASEVIGTNTGVVRSSATLNSFFN